MPIIIPLEDTLPAESYRTQPGGHPSPAPVVIAPEIIPVVMAPKAGATLDVPAPSAPGLDAGHIRQLWMVTLGY